MQSYADCTLQHASFELKSGYSLSFRTQIKIIGGKKILGERVSNLLEVIFPAAHIEPHHLLLLIETTLKYEIKSQGERKRESLEN